MTIGTLVDVGTVGLGADLPADGRAGKPTDPGADHRAAEVVVSFGDFAADNAACDRAEQPADHLSASTAVRVMVTRAAFVEQGRVLLGQTTDRLRRCVRR